MARRFNLNIGDIFTIPLGNNEFGFGQVVSPYDKRSGGFMVAVFSYKSDDPIVAINEICSKELLFLGFTFDAKIYHKDWTLIGNYILNIKNITMPYYRLGTPPEIYIIDSKGERIKKIDEKTFNNLNYKTEIAPIRYENALKAYYGLKEWKEEDYDELLYKHSIKSNEIFESVKGFNLF